MGRHLLAVVVLIVLVIAGADRFVWAQTLPPNYNAYLTGQGFSGAFNMDITISASRANNGTVRGKMIVKDNFSGDVIELIPPSNGTDYWCVNSALVEVPGFNHIWFVKDLPAGDKLAFTGDFGLTCAAAETPSEFAFETLTSGDFVGEIVEDTCKTELAQCNAQVADLNAQLGQCQADLGQCAADLNQCNADLTECEDKCELPPLPANYNAKLSGNGLSAFWNARVKISATRKETSEINGTVNIQDVLAANVIQVVAPSGGQNHWCVNSVVTSAATNANIGLNLILHVRDTFNGRDLLSSTLGTGLSCNTAVPTEPFEQICKSSFKGKVRCDDNLCC